jgi:hypothetical protein
MNIQKVFRTKAVLSRMQVLVEFKPSAYRMMEWDNQDPKEMAPLIARNMTQRFGPWSQGEEMMVDVDSLGSPYIDGSHPHSAGRLWVYPLN